LRISMADMTVRAPAGLRLDVCGSEPEPAFTK
jgi:hypothetical protein